MLNRGKISLTVICLVLQAFAMTVGQTFQDEQALRRKLLQEYDRTILPVKNQTNALNLQVAFNLLSIHDLDEKNQVLRSTSDIELIWNNQLLTWDPANYGGINSILLEPIEAWIPDIVVENRFHFQPIESIPFLHASDNTKHLLNGSFQHSPASFVCQLEPWLQYEMTMLSPLVSPDRFIWCNKATIRLFHTGYSIWYPGSVMGTQCSMGLTKYPFDTQECEIHLVSWMYPKQQLNVFAGQSLSFNNYQEHGEWDLTAKSIKNETRLYESEYSVVVYTFTFRRRVAFHVINTVIPVITLSILNVLVFLLPPETGEKMSLSITVLLAYTVYLSIISENMPTISTSVSILAIYVVLILTVGTTSTFLSAIVVHLAFDQEGSNRRFFSWGRSKSYDSHGEKAVDFGKHNESETLVPCPSPKAFDNQKASDGKGPRMQSASIQTIHKRDFADKIDVASFWIMLTVIVLFGSITFILIIFGNF